MNRIFETIARWYFVNYLQPLIDAHLKAQAAKAEMTRQKFIGER